MEADEYFSTYDALHEDGVPPGRLTIREKYASGISKIVWSSFDFMTGPELRFVWETTSLSNSPANVSNEEGSINDVESLDSSLSTQSAQYEEIDDPLEAELETTEMFDSMMLSDSAYGFFTSSPMPKYETEHYLGDYMTESRSTTTLTNSTLGMSDSRLGSEASTSRSPKIIEEGSSGGEEVDEMGNFIGTVIENSTLSTLDLSALLTVEQPQSADSNLKNKDSIHDDGSDTLTDGSSFAKLTESEQGSKLEEDIKKSTDLVLTTSCVDSGIGGTASMHSELDVLCQSPVYPVRGTHCTVNRGRNSPEADDLTSVLDMSLDAPDETITDEYFVAKFVLAEQICTTQLPSNPLMHKMTIVPTRGLLATSYIFSADAKDGRKTIHAISFLLNSSRVDWCMIRQNFFETIITDSVPRLKASLYTDSFDDVIVRATSELTRLLDLVGCLDRFPLVSPERPLLLKHTLFASRSCENDKILPKVISGVLQSQGHCVVIGSNQQYVAKLLYTLALFLPEELRWCAVRTYRHSYNPYIRLQAIRRAELPHVVRFGTMSTWPICVVDVDQGTVCMSAPYSRHRVVRQRAELERLESLLELRCAIKNKSTKLELSSCKVLDCVKKFLHQMDLLPYEESTRLGFVQQLLLYIENMAYVFIEYVRETSIPLANEKTNPSKGGRFSLSECRKALDLQSDSWFHAVLAKAELIHPEIADFIFT